MTDTTESLDIEDTRKTCDIVEGFYKSMRQRLQVPSVDLNIELLNGEWQVIARAPEDETGKPIDGIEFGYTGFGPTLFDAVASLRKAWD